MIGIVGGIGPLAGADLYKKMVENTIAQYDQDHLPVFLASLPGEIADRTNFLLGKSNVNPAAGLAKVILMLENAGANLIGIACNTAHAPVIFNPMLETLQAAGSKVDLVNLIDETVQTILTSSGNLQKIGVLSTIGTYQTRLYHNPLEAACLTPVLLSLDRHEQLVHDAIFQIKASADTVPDSVIFQLNTAVQELKDLGAEAVILGCTEIGMIEHRLDFLDLGTFNPNTILARELIRRIAPEKLKKQAPVATLAE